MIEVARCPSSRRGLSLAGAPRVRVLTARGSTVEGMAPNDRPSQPKRKTPAERSEELAEASRVLKQEAAERRAKREKDAPPSKPVAGRPKGT
jgi:hypothetical protein